MVITNK